MPHLDDLRRRASARWAEIAAISPDLAPAVTLQQRLITLTLEAAAGLDQGLPPGLTPEGVETRWRRGVPALRQVPVAIPEPLIALLPAFCTAIAEGGAGDAARHVQDALVHGGMDGGLLLRVSLARNRKAIRTSALHMGFSPDLVWLVGELGSAPLAHHLQTRWRAGGTAPPLTDWDRGYCPFCGSWPVFIESIEGARTLRCWYCALGWALQSHRCVYCGHGGDGFVAAAPDPGRSDQRVELCRPCGSYTKLVEVADATPFPLLAIEDLATLELDRGAMDREYRRPDLFDLDAIDPLTSPGCA